MIALPPLPLPIGAKGSRFAVNTPSLILDLDIMEANIAKMAATMLGFGRALRPHAKSHKSSRIAAQQLVAGAVGICCATLDEAEVMVAAGLRGVVITSPVTSLEKIARLIDLVRAAPDTMIVVDNADNVHAIAAAAERAGIAVILLVDIELGFGRTGVRGADAAVALARAVEATPGVSFGGIQAYGGHLQHILDYGERKTATEAASKGIASIVARLAKAGLPPAIVTGGGTGTHTIDGAASPLTEIQAGSYLLMDSDYGGIAYSHDQPWPFGVSLFVQTTVISTNVPGTITVDAGTKALALNGKPPRVATPDLGAAVYEFTGDEHGRIRLPEGVPAPKIGSRLELIVSHCDPTVAMYDTYHCVRGDSLVDVWPIDARRRR